MTHDDGLGLAGAALTSHPGVRTPSRGGGRDHLFPLLTGLGVTTGFLICLWAIPTAGFLSPLLAVIFAVPLATLRIRRYRIRWLGTRYTVACVVAALGTGLSLVVTNGLNPIMTGRFALHESVAEAPVFLVFIALEGLLSVWFAVLLQRWADHEVLVAARSRSRWNPRSWGTLGAVGGALILLGATGLAWTVAVYPYRFRPGPTYSGYWYLGLEMTMVALVGLGGLVAEALRGRIFGQHPTRFP